jgi:hypothetical protein
LWHFATGETMARCIEFFREWKKKPNFCGLGKTAADGINKYLILAEDIADTNEIPVESVYHNVQETAVKSLLRFNPDSDIRKRAIKEIGKLLKSKQGITGKYVNTILIGLTPRPKAFVQPTQRYRAEPATDTSKRTDITNKIRLLKSVLTSGQIKILNDIMVRENLDNEYEALSWVIIWAEKQMK